MSDLPNKTRADGGADIDADANADEEENTGDTLRVTNDETAGATDEIRTTQDVRQGHTGDHVRYILAASIAGIVIIFAIVYLYFVQ